MPSPDTEDVEHALAHTVLRNIHRTVPQLSILETEAQGSTTRKWRNQTQIQCCCYYYYYSATPDTKYSLFLPTHRARIKALFNILNEWEMRL